MTALPQGSIIAILLGGVVSFYLFVIISSRKNKDKARDEKNKPQRFAIILCMLAFRDVIKTRTSNYKPSLNHQTDENEQG